MVSLVDIIDIKKTVTIRGKDIEVEGINAEKLAMLFNDYPMMRLAFTGKTAEMTPATITALGPMIAASIIAAAIGKPGDKEEEKAAAKLSLGEQVTILAAVIEVTFPEGFGPFVERLRSLGLFESEDGGPGWGRATNSHAASSPSPPAAATEAAPPS